MERRQAPGRGPRIPVAAALIVLTVVAVWFLSEIARRTWLAGADADAINVFQAARDIVASLLAASAVGWYLVRDRPSLFPPEPAPAVWPSYADRPAEDPLRHYVSWFIRMRWIAVLAAGLLSVTVVQILHLLEAEVFVALMICVGLLAATNLAYHVLLERGILGSRLVEMQIVADLVILTALLHYSGGIENPLTPIAIFHVIISGILLPHGRSYFVAAVAGALFTGLAFAEWSGTVDHYTLRIFPHGEHEEVHAAHQISYVVSRSLLQVLVLFLTSYFITTIMDRLRAEERHALAMSSRAVEERRMLEQVVEATGVGLIVLDAELRPVWLNEQIRSWLGIPEDGSGSPPDPDLDWIRSPAERTLADGRPRVIDDELSVPGGGKRQLQVNIAAVPGQDAGTRQIVGLVQDVTEQRQAQARLTQASRMAAVGELAGSVAHEVNNPVSIISAKARLLLSDYADGMSGKVRADVGRIVDLADRVGKIAQGLLSYCRPSPAAKTSLDLLVPLRKSLALVDHAMNERGIGLVESVPDRLPPVVANAGEMEQVFLNLLVNAVDAMPDGGTLEVSAAVERPADGRSGLVIAVEIRDTGTGIPGEVLDRIFEPFFTTKEDGKGTGLGLSICEGLLRGHGGSIRVDSQEGKGTRFVVRIPAEESRG